MNERTNKRAQDSERVKAQGKKNTRENPPRFTWLLTFVSHWHGSTRAGPSSLLTLTLLYAIPYLATDINQLLRAITSPFTFEQQPAKKACAVDLYPSPRPDCPRRRPSM